MLSSLGLQIHSCALTNRASLMVNLSPHLGASPQLHTPPLFDEVHLMRPLGRECQIRQEAYVYSVRPSGQPACAQPLSCPALSQMVACMPACDPGSVRSPGPPRAPQLGTAFVGKRGRAPPRQVPRTMALSVHSSVARQYGGRPRREISQGPHPGQAAAHICTLRPLRYCRRELTTRQSYHRFLLAKPSGFPAAVDSMYPNAEYSSAYNCPTIAVSSSE